MTYVDEYGDGNGYGYEYGDGNGYGYGDGNGYGYGYGYGNGYGHGNGYGYGSGNGDGYGSGNGDGYGYGNGNGKLLGHVEDHQIYILLPWAYVRVDCEVHTVEWWEKNWRRLAEREGLGITDQQATQLLEAAREYLIPATGKDGE